MTEVISRPADIEWWAFSPTPMIRAGRHALEHEAEGWFGTLLCDSQNALGDVYVGLALAAQSTERLMIGTGVTNPLTRHPAVTAAAAATLQEITGGRMVLGLGRGDSSAAFLGLGPLAVPRFEQYLVVLRKFLAGVDVDMTESASFSIGQSFADLNLAGSHDGSRLRWLRSTQQTVPVDVAATGPAVIRVAARHADRVTFSVGASPDRLRWALELGRRCAEEAGRDPDSISWGAYVNVVCDDDRERAIALGAGSLATFARFSVMKGKPVGEMPERDKELLVALHRVYDMTKHGESASSQAELITDTDFADRFGIIGDPEHCLARLRELSTLGLQRVVVMGPSVGVAEDQVDRTRGKFVSDLLPFLPGGTRTRPVAASA
jgi:5,10-methylenetetrahydromethanopterin reductase